MMEGKSVSTLTEGIDMRLIIFASLGLFGISVAASGFSTTASATSEELISGTVSDIYRGGTVAIDGYKSHLRLDNISNGFPSLASERVFRQSLSSLIKGKRISCKRLRIDNYGVVVARCWNNDGREITKGQIHQNVVSVNLVKSRLQ